MKKMILTVACLLAGFSVSMAGDPSVVGPFVFSGVTNVAEAVTNTASVSGYLEGLYVDITTVAPTGTVIVSTVAKATLPARTLFTGAFAADGYVPVQVLTANAANSASTANFAKQPLFNDKLVVSLQSSTSNINANVTVFVSQED